MNPETVYLAVIIVAMLVSLTVHEVAHARTALAFGDPTAKLMGRVSFNPLRHLDRWGTVAMIVSAWAGYGFGWAKPVPVNPANLHPPRLGDIMVSLAGPLSNLGLAAVAGLTLRAITAYEPAWLVGANGDLVTTGIRTFLRLNLALCLFNLLPLFPLDGHHIQREILPTAWKEGFMQWQMRFGQFLLLGLIFLPPFIGRAMGIEGLSFFRPIYLYVGLPLEQFFVGD